MEISDQDRQKVLLILLQNGNFRSLDKNTFEIGENTEKTIEKIKKEGIRIKILES